MQIFPRSLNKLPQIVAGASVMGLVGATFGIWYFFSPYWTQVGYTPKQPVPYSHRLHAGQLGMDCRYCHVNVERSAHAMVPPTETCMNCHQVVKTDSAALQPIRDSWASGEPVKWTKVHKVADYAYFDHSVHVTAGVGCVQCHGRIDQMEVVRQSKPLSMGWCLECHRDVKAKQGDSQYIGPVSEVTNLAYVHTVHVDPPRTLNPPENCGGCHR